MTNPWMPVEKGHHITMSVDRASVPQKHNGTPEVFQQMSEKAQNIRALEVLGPKMDIERQMSLLGRNRDRADCRYSILSIQMAEEGCLALRRPCPFDVRNEQKSAFIEENEMGATFFGVFLYGATVCASTPRFPLPSFVERDVPVSDNSIPFLAGFAKHDWGDSRCRIDLQ